MVIVRHVTLPYNPRTSPSEVTRHNYLEYNMAAMTKIGNSVEAAGSILVYIEYISTIIDRMEG